MLDAGPDVLDLDAERPHQLARIRHVHAALADQPAPDAGLLQHLANGRVVR